jgi:hypothetical protein
MADRWFYARDGEKQGPFSAQQFRSLARDGTLLITDTVWKNDVAQGVSAAKVKNLFPAPAAAPPPAVGSEPAALVPPPAARPPAAPAAPPAHLEPPRPKKATAVSGAIVVSQDGKYVRFRKKCTACQHEASSWGTMAILPGTMRTTFYCPNCRKTREVLLRGMQA